MAGNPPQLEREENSMQIGKEIASKVRVRRLGMISAAAMWRAAILLAIGGGVGLALGVVLTTGVFVTHQFLTPTLPLPTAGDSLQILNELNDLRHLVNTVHDLAARRVGFKVLTGHGATTASGKCHQTRKTGS